MKTKKIFLLGSMVLLLFSMACNINIGGFALSTLPVDDLRTDKESIEVGQAQTVQAEILMKAGELSVSGGANELLEADFTYNVEDWRPEISYVVEDGQGKLTVQQPVSELRGIPTDEVRNQWRLILNKNTPLDLILEIGAGTGRFDLRELSLERVHIKAGAGESIINLAGSSIPELAVDAGLGEVTLDLSGPWTNDLEAKLRSGVGEMTLKLPREVGVRVDVKTGMAEVQARGLKQTGGVYVNDAYGQTEVTLNIEVQGGVGQINLKTVNSEQ